MNPNSIKKMFIDYEKFNKLGEKLNDFSTQDFKVIFRESRIERVSKKQDYDKCYGLPFFAIINEKGNVEPCFLYYDKPEFSYGNIYENKFSEIWNSDKRKNVLAKLNGIRVEGCKKGCRLDTINSYLHRLKNPQPHDNFI
jgi:radical SAM protein with 4Fe4S-binding SPASM domain